MKINMIDGKFLPSNTHFLICSEGMSMYPTLKPYDRLLLKQYNMYEKVHKGDVVAFIPPCGGDVIVHRIIKIGAEGMIWTKGDNNYTYDPWVVLKDKIIGQITYVCRSNRKLVIYGGVRGNWQAFFIRFLKHVGFRVNFLLKLLRYRIAEKWLMRAFFNRLVRVRIFTINASNFELHVLLGKKVIGRYISRDAKWHIQRPYQPLVDTQRLARIFPDS